MRFGFVGIRSWDLCLLALTTNGRGESSSYLLLIPSTALSNSQSHAMVQLVTLKTSARSLKQFTKKTCKIGICFGRYRRLHFGTGPKKRYISVIRLKLLSKAGYVSSTYRNLEIFGQ